MPDHVGHRQGLHAMPEPDFAVFRGVCRELGPLGVGGLSKVFFGGYQSKAAQALWDPFESHQCRFCGQLDTKTHRQFECPAHAHVRQPFQALLDWVQYNASHWPFCALPSLHPDVGVLRLVWSSRKVRPQPPPSALVPQYSLDVCHFYTDGTCAHNACPVARHAAWSVVLDCDPHGSPETVLLAWLHDKRTPQSYHVVHQGLVPGQQSIDRAELCALLQVCHDAASMPHVHCIAWTDSQYALDAVQQWNERSHQNGGPIPTNYDIFASMQVPCKPGNLTLRKIKAHTEAAVAPLSEVRHVLGNAAADIAADMARKSDFAFVVDLVDEVYDHSCIQKDAFLLSCRYQQELTRSVAAADARARETALGTTYNHDDEEATFHMLVQRWMSGSVDGPEEVPLVELPEQWPRVTSWPQWFLSSLWIWKHSLLWPEAPDRRLQRGEGVTFLELLVNYVVVACRLPPVSSDFDRSLADPLSAEGILRPLTVRELVANFVSATDFLTRVCGQAFWGASKHHRIYSLTLLGERSPRKGLRQRPGMLAARRTAQLLVKVLQNAHAPEIMRDFALRNQSM